MYHDFSKMQYIYFIFGDLHKMHFMIVIKIVLVCVCYFIKFYVIITIISICDKMQLWSTFFGDILICQ